MPKYKPGDVVWVKTHNCVAPIYRVYRVYESEEDKVVKYEFSGGLICSEEDVEVATPEMEDIAKQTMEHIENVDKFIQVLREKLMERALNHDSSKLSPEEFPDFIEYTPKLRGMTYGSDEYKECLKAIKPSLDHHYEVNRHHPEHYDDGVEGMNLVDLCEMLADWKAATLRHEDGDILKSIEINSKRFDISPQLSKILSNTVREYFED